MTDTTTIERLLEDYTNQLLVNGLAADSKPLLTAIARIIHEHDCLREDHFQWCDAETAATWETGIFVLKRIKRSHTWWYEADNYFRPDWVHQTGNLWEYAKIRSLQSFCPEGCYD